MSTTEVAAANLQLSGRFRFWLANADASEQRSWRNSASHGGRVFPLFVANPRTARLYTNPAGTAWMAANPIVLLSAVRSGRTRSRWRAWRVPDSESTRF